jgi:hypothetical protein
MNETLGHIITTPYQVSLSWIIAIVQEVFYVVLQTADPSSCAIRRSTADWSINHYNYGQMICFYQHCIKGFSAEMKRESHMNKSQKREGYLNWGARGT